EALRYVVGNAGHRHVALEAMTRLHPGEAVRADLGRLVQLGQVEVQQHALRKQDQVGVLGLPSRRHASELAELDGPRLGAAAAAVHPGVDAVRVALERHADRGVRPLASPDALGALTQPEELGASVGGERSVAEPLPQLAARSTSGLLELPEAVAR